MGEVCNVVWSKRKGGWEGGKGGGGGGEGEREREREQCLNYKCYSVIF